MIFYFEILISTDFKTCYRNNWNQNQDLQSEQIKAKCFDCPTYFLFWSVSAKVLRLSFLILIWKGQKRTQTLPPSFFFLANSSPGRNSSCDHNFRSDSLLKVKLQYIQVISFSSIRAICCNSHQKKIHSLLGNWA